ncbi:NAD(P)/FAD-dependent oxidoreductase [Mycolicibacterium rufum]|uniref:NAD(P)/FAD-dependent oxidoreductase n=1 Tax=Mycolicibacterium rufum TaxID=318424 RepID=A0A9X2XZ45_9MYCO|nr:NAD(P)/FAD-dependent oxidoreductase [Mycolicibacterium rufum]KGI66898.1 pyridine nucleotide-disulfide oxidoreductase [Mycolicibacterium rufum]MCV7071431.1 NAD(P)/FAD-dependent oxidoreductase [Mycolicibacterium rufum]ULP37737.1 NAD(P)/FAD-dependent oxidoreductase [Mycolicibacterium rufum]
MEWECAVIGGGAAGLSGALVLGRARRKIVVVDADDPSNRAAPAIGGLLGFDQRPPDTLYATGRAELDAYPSVTYRRGEVTRGRAVDNGYLLDLADGTTISAKRVLLASGMVYCPPPLPGLGELWGRSVFQCPFCHGWEMRDRRLAALAAGTQGVHMALMLRGWTDDVILLTDGRSELSLDDRRVLQSAGIEVDDRRVVELIGADGALSEIAFADGTRLARQGLLVEAPVRQRSSLAAELGATCTPGPLGTEPLTVDTIHRTSAHGVFAAGDVCTQQPHIAGAIASGSQAAMIIVQSLLADEFGLPYPPVD